MVNGELNWAGQISHRTGLGPFCLSILFRGDYASKALAMNHKFLMRIMQNNPTILHAARNAYYILLVKARNKLFVSKFAFVPNLTHGIAKLKTINVYIFPITEPQKHSRWASLSWMQMREYRSLSQARWMYARQARWTYSTAVS